MRYLTSIALSMLFALQVFAAEPALVPVKMEVATPARVEKLLQENGIPNQQKEQGTSGYVFYRLTDTTTLIGLFGESVDKSAFIETVLNKNYVPTEKRGPNIVFYHQSQKK
jgi:hypothetical protein